MLSVKPNQFIICYNVCISDKYCGSVVLVFVD